VAYGAAKADQRAPGPLLAAELGPHGIRVNGVNPDRRVAGSASSPKGWGAERAQVYGVQEEDARPRSTRSATLLKREFCPSTWPAPWFALTGGDLTHTTGLHIPVDAGVAAGFLR
jgi:NAD(P)-dependent dehydrogenase (short-subunit alcohol dehydrogenase family)